MLFVIPAWYQNNTWSENEQIWYERRVHTEFDDSVKQIQLFHRNSDIDFRMLLLSYSPNLRHFLHRQGVFRARYWSCFDAIQEVERKNPYVLSFHDIMWPEGVEFIYSAFAVIVLLQGKKYAQIEFGEDGNPIIIDMFNGDELIRRNIYDDRGFVSSSILYENDTPKFQEFYTEKGIKKVTLFFEDGSVEVNEHSAFYLLDYDGQKKRMPYKMLKYSSIEALLREILEQFLVKTSSEDMFCIAMHNKHTELLYNLLKNKKTILSFFGERYLVSENPEDIEMIKNAGYIIIDELDHLKRIQAVVNNSLKNVIDITPYDTRIDTSISDHLYVQKILVPIDYLLDEDLPLLIEMLTEYLHRNSKARIHLFTRKSVYNQKEFLMNKIKEILNQIGENGEMVDEDIDDPTENHVDYEDLVIQKFVIEQCVSELEVSKCIREQRLVLDVRKGIDLYLQVAAISMGIPQIVMQETQFVKDNKNGIVLKDLEDIPDCLEFYLGSLKNWNNAQIQSYEIGREYTTQVLVGKWKEVIGTLGEH